MARGVSFTATSTIAARTGGRGRRLAGGARRSDVSLEATENGRTVRLYVEGPFRDCAGAAR